MSTAIIFCVSAFSGISDHIHHAIGQPLCSSNGVVDFIHHADGGAERVSSSAGDASMVSWERHADDRGLAHAK